MIRKPFLEITNLGKTFPGEHGGNHCVVDDFNLQMACGEFVSIVGHSGCGKSTVLSIVAGLIRSSTGGVIVAGKEVISPGRDRGMVFQNPSLLPWLSARENVLLGVKEAFPKKTRAQQREMADHHLRQVGLEGAMNQKPAELSQGMRQRVGIARAFAIQPRVLLLDEPFGMLDSLTRLELQEVLVSVWTASHTTALLVTHDVDEALFLSDRVVVMSGGPAATVSAILHLPFTRPRDRVTLQADTAYDQTREKLLHLLEENQNQLIQPNKI